MALVAKKELSRIARGVVSAAAGASGKKRAFLVFLDGNLGAGKTAFAQKFGELLGVKEKIHSPTFVFVREHAIVKKGLPYRALIHLDAYRLETKRDFESLRLKDHLKNPANIVCVEWAEKIKKRLPKPDIMIEFRHHSKDKRNVRITENS